MKSNIIQRHYRKNLSMNQFKFRTNQFSIMSARAIQNDINKQGQKRRSNQTTPPANLVHQQILQTTSRVQFNKANQKNIANQVQQEQTDMQSISSYSSQVACRAVSILFRSLIIKNMGDLKKLLDFGRAQYSLRLIYRASQHNFDAEIFHKICKDIYPTITLAEIVGGNIVGGYTSLKWNDLFDATKTHFKTDKACTSFLFNFSAKEKFNLIKLSKNKAIVGCKYLGPTFGGGYDFSIGNFADRKFSSSCQYPTSYEKRKQNASYKISRKLFTGVNQDAFLIKQWEVFHVCFNYQSQNNQDKEFGLKQKQKQKKSSQFNIFNRILSSFT